MTSLIGWTAYGIHKGIVSHRRDKQRRKNYDRWEGLRDDYDEQKRVSRQSVDSETRPSADLDRPIVTLRDQQEANDARTSWRPQEQLDRINPDMTGRGNGSPLSAAQTQPIRKQKTGAVWDEGIPERLRVERRSFDDRPYNYNAPAAGPGAGAGGAMSRVQSDESKRSASLDVQRPNLKKDDFEVVESPYNWWER